MSSIPADKPDPLSAALESARNPQPLPEDPPLVNNNNVGIYMTLAKSADAIRETREILKRLNDE